MNRINPLVLPTEDKFKRNQQLANAQNTYAYAANAELMQVRRDEHRTHKHAQGSWIVYCVSRVR